MREQRPRFEDLVTDPSFQSWALRSDPEAVRYWDGYLEEHPDLVDLADEAREVVLTFEAGRPAIPPERAEQSWRVLAPQLQTGPQPAIERNDRSPRARRPRKRPRRTLFAAVAVVLILAAGVLVGSGALDHEEQFATAENEIGRYMLPDGSTVVLNQESTLTYRTGILPGSPRKAILDGEGYFDVIHLDDIPFRVHASDLRLEVLGTSFNVKSRQGETEVVLEAGAVRLRHNRRSEDHLMRPGDLIKFAPEGEAVVLHGVDPAPYVGWVNDLLVFEETSVEEIAGIIEDRIGVQVVIGDPSLRDRTLTGEVVARDLDFLLDVMGASLGVQARRTADTLYLNQAR